MRLDERTAARLREVARLAGMSESHIIRDAVAARSDTILGDRLASQLAGFIGVVDSRGGRAEGAHEKFGALLKQRRKAARGRRSQSRS